MARTSEYGDDSGEQQAQKKAATRDRLLGIVSNLEREAENRVNKRNLIEQRWLTDIRQYEGHYEDKIKRDLRDARKSSLFVNKTRSKTNACEAKLSDMLFPTDDRNYGIKPTPVPELTVEAEEAARKAAQAKMKLSESPEQIQNGQVNPQHQQLQQQADEAEEMNALIQARMDEANKRAKLMEEEIDDKLRGCKYSIQARDVIRDGCILGTGIMKGPVIGEQNRKAWQKGQDGQYALNDVEDKRPVYWRVDPWSFFPDMDARTVEDSEGFYERHLMNPKQMRRLARQPGFDKDAFRRLLIQDPRETTPTYLADLRAMSGAYNDSTVNRYHVWEYHGPLSMEDMRLLAEVTGKNQIVEDIDENEIDPLTEMNAVVWFCQGELLKFGIHSLDSGDPLYSVFNLEKDPSSIFGYGVPYIMRDPQSAMNGAWRTLMDNAGLSSGPQIEIDSGVGEPVNGEWALEPRKLWKRREGADPNSPLIRTYDIPSHMKELIGIIEVSKQNIDEETNITTLAQGEQGTHTTKTKGGMALLMNATNVVFRRMVKNWDDDMTTPNVQRMYDWLMQFSEKDHIKGDYQVDARGTSVLLVREVQSQNLMVFLMNFSGHPILGRFLKEEGLPAMRHLAQTMMLPADDVIKSRDEIAREDAAMANQPPPPNPEMEKIAADRNIAEMKADTEMRLAEYSRETELIKLAATNNITLDELEAKLKIERERAMSRERIFASEAAMEEKMARQGIATGSGGYLSAGGDDKPEARPQ